MESRPDKKAHELLLGTWRSDRQRTEAQWVWPKKIAAARQHEFFNLFGHLTHRFTRSRCYSTNFEGNKAVHPYRIVWQGQSVFPQLVVVYSIPAKERAQHFALFGFSVDEKAQHIFFDSEDSYYVQGGKCAEFFRREA